MPSRKRIAAAALGATAAIAVPASVAASSYVVRPGDSIAEIAVRHGTTIAELVSANEIANPQNLIVGQMLQIPDSKLGLPRYTADEDDTESYVVKAGEGIIQIARFFGVDATALARTNGIGVNANLEAGAILHVPGQFARSNALLVQIAGAVGINAALIKAVAWMESGWQQNVVSPTGAVGMMQIEPFTGEWVSNYLAHQALNIQVASDNVTAGCLLLKHLHGVHNGDVSAALAAYYQGDGSIARHGLYDDTRRYQRVVTDLVARE
jgi:LysM repeat protein